MAQRAIYRFLTTALVLTLQAAALRAILILAPLKSLDLTDLSLNESLPSLKKRGEVYSSPNLTRGGLKMKWLSSLLTLVISATFLTAQPQLPPNQGEKTMVFEQTLSIIKPDAVNSNVIGQIIARFEQNGLRIAAAKMMCLSETEGGELYAVHRERPFYNDLKRFIASGPIVVMVLEGDNAILKNREIMGATNPKDAASGTIRADFAESIDANAVHGSDSSETAKEEIAFFFRAEEIHSRYEIASQES